MMAKVCCVYILQYNPLLIRRFIHSELFIVVHVIGRRRVRGETSMPKVWAKHDGDRISVSFNENGQPVDKKTTRKLSHFIRSLVRSGKYYPLHKPWLKVDIAKKQTLLDILNDTFDLPPGSNDWILNYFENKVKSWRARVKKHYYDPSLPFRDQINSKPKRVRLSDWNKIVKAWNKENSKQRSMSAAAFQQRSMYALLLEYLLYPGHVFHITNGLESVNFHTSGLFGIHLLDFNSNVLPVFHSAVSMFLGMKSVLAVHEHVEL
ncbi:hypothetical protein Tco_0741411 [Tanacetum coccineum]